MGGRGGVRSVSKNSAGGISYIKSVAAKRSGDVAVKVSVAKLSAAWKKDKISFIPDGGQSNTTGDKYAQAKSFVKTTKEAVKMPEIAIKKDGSVVIRDGRHRTAALRDLGKKEIFVTVSRAAAKRVKDSLGAD